MFASPGEIAFHLFSIPIYFYGVIMAFAMSTAIFVSLHIAKNFYPEIDPDVIISISPFILIGAIIGARLYYCIFSWDYFSHNLLEVFQIWKGGMSIHGGIIGGLLAGGVYAKNKALPILKLCDIFSFGLVLGQAIGRWGNFFNSEAFGSPTQNFLKLYIPIHKRPVEFLQFDYFHPTFLYESVLDVIIFLLLFFVIRKSAKKTSGVVFFSYLILYSFVRLLVESFRIDSVFNLFGFPIAQIVSVLIILISTISLFVIRLNNENK